MVDLTRREFMGCCSAAIAALSGSRILNLSFASPLLAGANANGPILVVVFLRGGMDGLHFLGPANTPEYVAARPIPLRVNESGDHAGLPIDSGLSGLDFRLHKSAGPLRELYQSKNLGFVHACGLTNGTRSHFEAMDYVERGTSGEAATNQGRGWIARLCDQLPTSGPVRALGAVDRLPTSMLGLDGALAMSNPEAFSIPVGEPVAKYLKGIYQGSSDVHRAGSATLTTIEQVHKKLKDDKGQWIPYAPSNGARYPEGELGNSLKSVARMVKADLGLQVAAVDYGGWDTHEGQEYRLPAMIDHLSRSLSAFYNDLTPYSTRLNVVVMSEFGRRLRANQSQGTDHGHGNVMMLIGAGVQGGKVHGPWPGLATDKLDQGADLAITTDYRTVLAELIVKRLGVKDTQAVFTGFKGPNSAGVFA